MRTFGRVWCVMILMAFWGCTSMQSYPYDVSIKNGGRVALTDANVVYGQFKSGGGNLLSGSTSVYSHPEYPIPREATVEWRTPDGTLHKKTVEVKSVVPKDFKGEIQFEIDDDNGVTVRAISEPR